MFPTFFSIMFSKVFPCLLLTLELTFVVDVCYSDGMWRTQYICMEVCFKGLVSVLIFSVDESRLIPTENNVCVSPNRTIYKKNKIIIFAVHTTTSKIREIEKVKLMN